MIERFSSASFHQPLLDRKRAFRRRACTSPCPSAYSVAEFTQATESRRFALSPLRIEALRFLDRGPVDLTIDAGECVALAGPSGCGKSLMLRALADLDPHEGLVRLGDAATGDLDAPSWRARVGLLPAESQWWSDTVGEHFPETDGCEPRAAWLEQLGFAPEAMSWTVSRLSTGEKQRLALLRLLCNLPQALLLDEPTGSLDPAGVTRVENLLSAHRKDHGTPVIWVTHDPGQMARVADRGFRMDAGRLVEQVYP